ncbi:uncharacterized protein [Dysidea avara]|uniref:uncharacterized protein n=1 Tax=Dysidea avara TaxID=196820 RepID=UPI0033305625
MVSVVILVSVLLGAPLAVVDYGDYPLTTKCLPLTEIVLDTNAHLMMLSSVSKGEYILSASSYQLALSLSNNTIMAVHRDGVEEEDYKFTFRGESIDNQEYQSRYYVESDGSRYYLMVQPNGVVTTQSGSDLVTDDYSTTFRTVHG